MFPITALTDHNATAAQQKRAAKMTKKGLKIFWKAKQPNFAYCNALLLVLSHFTPIPLDPTLLYYNPGVEEGYTCIRSGCLTSTGKNGNTLLINFRKHWSRLNSERVIIFIKTFIPRFLENAELYCSLFLPICHRHLHYYVVILSLILTMNHV